MEKGIILSPQVSPGKGNGHQAIIHEKMSLDDLRFALLFWDKFDVTCYEKFSYRMSPDFPNPNQELDVLIDEGLAIVDTDGIDLKNVTSEPLYIQDFVALEPYAVLHKYLSKTDADWSFFQTGGSLHTPDKCAETRETIEFQFYKMLPVPSAEIPIHDVLEFKLKRSDELLALRDTMDELVGRVCAAEQTEKEATRMKDKLSNEIAAYTKVTQEFNSKTVIKSLNQIVTNPINAYPSAISVIGSVLGQIPTDVSSILSLTALGSSAVNFIASTQNVYSKLPEELYKYAYLSSAEQELQ